MALPELLRGAEYYTVMAGKWHLGRTPKHAPVSRGFEKSNCLLGGGGNHYGYCPPCTKEDMANNFFLYDSNKDEFMEEDKFYGDVPEDWYSTDSWTTKLLDYLKEQPKDDDRPFFAYLAFQAPHFPLQVDKEYRDNYKGRYDAGPEAIRDERLDRLKKLGFFPDSLQAPPFHDYAKRKSNQDWHKRSEKARAHSARKMEVFAGMVENIDHNVGRVLNYLEETKQLDDTIVIFMSDNGAEGGELEAQGTFTKPLKKYYDNSLENLAEKDSYCWYGSRWAQVGSAPCKLFKMHTHQGGIRVVSLVHYPKWQERAGKICKEYCTVMDILPTMLELAQAPPQNGTYKGRTVEKVKGKSWVPTWRARRTRSTQTIQ